MDIAHADFSSLLLRDRVLTPSALRGARSLQRQTRGRLADVLVEFGYASAEQVESAMGEVARPWLHRANNGWRDLKIERLMHRNSIAVYGESAIAYFLVKLIPCANLRNVEMHIRPVPDVKIKRLRQVMPVVRTLELEERQPRQLIARIDTLDHDRPTKYVIDVVLPRRPDGKYVAAMLEVVFDAESGQRESVVVPMEVVYTGAGHGYINGEVAKHIDEIQVAELNQSLQSAIGRAEPAAVRQAAEQVVRRGEVMGKAGAKKTMLAKMVLQEINAGGAVSKRTDPAITVPPMLERQATIRYYSQMAPERLFPLLVVIAEKAIREVVQEYVAQQTSAKFHVEQGSHVEVEPILPGCECFPPRQSVPIGEGEAVARFQVVPRVLGDVPHARVLIRQNGTVLAEVPLTIHVARQTLTMFVGAMNFCVPFVSMLLKQSQLSLTSSEAGGGLMAWMVGSLLLLLSPEVLAGLLLAATVGVYLWLRPRQRDVFWDIQAVAEPPP